MRRACTPPHSRITHTSNSTAHGQAHRSAATRACSPSLGSGHAADPLKLNEKPEQHQQQEQQQQNNNRLANIAVFAKQG